MAYSHYGVDINTIQTSTSSLLAIKTRFRYVLYTYYIFRGFNLYVAIQVIAFQVIAFQVITFLSL